MKRTKNGYTMRQYAYAKNALGAKGKSKKEIALDVGYSPAVANSVMSKIESTEGFQNAMLGLAAKAGNLTMAVMAEYEARGLKGFSNKDLNGALNAIAGAFSKFAQPDKNDPSKPNRLKGIIFQTVQNQTINAVPSKKK